MVPFIFFNVLFTGHTACGLLVPQPGIEPMLPPLGAQSLNHWTTRKVPKRYILKEVNFMYVNSISTRKKF